MNRTTFLALILCSAAASHLAAQESDPVRWRPERKVKDEVLAQIDQFELDLKGKLGPENLALKPYVVPDNFPNKAAFEATPLEQILDTTLKSMRKWVDHDNQDFLPSFVSFRRKEGGKGSDLLFAPAMGPAPAFGNLGGTTTVIIEWQRVEGRFQNNWDQNDVDEVYEVELNATLTLGIQLSMKSEKKMTFISHTVTKPLVTGWRTSLVASEGVVEEVLNSRK